MTGDELIERAERILKATHNIEQALKYLIREAKQLQKDVAEANQMKLFEETGDG